MKRFGFATLILLFFQNVSAQKTKMPLPGRADPNNIQLALLLDVSNSMDGLIAQAKSELWSVVNTAAGAMKNGSPARLEIALYEYGRSTNDRSRGYVKRLLPFTTDLDTVSEVLFSLTTNGGDEFCGEVIHRSLEELPWASGEGIYGVIFIAGNEPFNQGTTVFQNACMQALGRQIIINTIHCGDSITGVNQYWAQGAQLAGGSYFYINQGLKTEDPDTPFDTLIKACNDSINRTYLYYGESGRSYSLNQMRQDANSSMAGKKAYMERASAKGKGSVYRNTHWDAVDAWKADSAALNRIWEAGVDSTLRLRNAQELRSVLQVRSAERDRLRARMGRLSAQRSQYLTANMQARAYTAQATLGQALARAIREQAGTRGFVFE